MKKLIAFLVLAVLFSAGSLKAAAKPEPVIVKQSDANLIFTNPIFVSF